MILEVSILVIKLLDWLKDKQNDGKHCTGRGWIFIKLWSFLKTQITGFGADSKMHSPTPPPTNTIIQGPYKL